MPLASMPTSIVSTSFFAPTWVAWKWMSKLLALKALASCTRDRGQTRGPRLSGLPLVNWAVAVWLLCRRGWPRACSNAAPVADKARNPMRRWEAMVLIHARKILLFLVTRISQSQGKTGRSDAFEAGTATPAITTMMQSQDYHRKEAVDFSV